MKLWLMMFAAVAVLGACSQPAPEAAPPAPEAQTAAETPDPVAAVRAIYDLYLADTPPQTYPWSRDLMAKWQADTTGVRDADPLIMGQDWDIDTVDVSLVSPPEDGRAVVQASFANFGEQHVLFLDLVLEDGAWRIDNVRELNPPWDMRGAMAGN